LNLKTKFSVYVTVPTLIIMMGLGYTVVSLEKLHIKRNIENHHNDLIKTLAQKCSDSLRQNDLALFEFFRRLESEVGFVGAAMTDRDNVVTVHSDLARIGSRLAPPPTSFSGREDIQKQRNTVMVTGRVVLDFSAPIYEGNTIVGVARLFFDNKLIEEQLNLGLTKLMKQIVIIGTAAMALGLIGAWILAGKFIDPIDHLIRGMHNLSTGNLRPVPELSRHDEMGNMISEFNVMVHKLNELDLMKKEFVASVTHELRSPLTAIESFVALLLKGRYGPITAEQQESLTIVKNNVVRLSSFVDDVLVTAKLESKRMRLFIEEVDVREIVQETLSLFSSFSTRSEVKLKTEMPLEPVLLKTDCRILVHLLTNLISNGFKFTQEGTVTVRIKDSLNEVVLAVEDTGIGITPNEKGLIFEKFFRGLDATKATKGTGLGLSIAKSYVDLLKGEIGVADNGSRGSIFTVRLPKSLKENDID
jgi:signal transduction histidine kinase